MKYVITLAIAALISLTPPPILTFLADVKEGEGGSSDSDEESEEDEGVDDEDEIPEREGDALA